MVMFARGTLQAKVLNHLWFWVTKSCQWVRLLFSRLLGGQAFRPTAIATSMDLADNPLIASYLGYRPAFFTWLLPQRAVTYVGWGRRTSGELAIKLSKRYQSSFLLVEDGFIRSVGRRDTPLSQLYDDKGVYFDASQPSRLEELIGAPLGPEEVKRARTVISRWRAGRVSKYNASPEPSDVVPSKFVLVIDQVRADKSIEFGGAGAESFEHLLQLAMDESDLDIVVKMHPDSVSDSSLRHFDENALRQNPRVHVVSENCHPVQLIEKAEKVYVVTSQVGFEALLWGKPVRVVGMPFYAGWGLTEDILESPKRRSQVTLEQLVHAALIGYPRYRSPISGNACEVEDIIDYVSLQRRNRFQFPPVVAAVGFSRWKRKFIREFMTGSRVEFLDAHGASPTKFAQDAVVVWGMKENPFERSASTTIRVEDGFIRSSGLGAELVAPLSLVFDDVGIYFDATRRSKLEDILNDLRCSDHDLARAENLQGMIIDLDITKYNVGTCDWQSPCTTQRKILVVGQVESDASIVFGSPEVKSNLELLKMVRAANPEEHILYKPHPDVAAGLRAQGSGEESAADFCDEIIDQKISGSTLLKSVDEVHTMTSLMGFEALLRGVKVTCYGLPFYAGWGLTEDRLTCERRQRVLTLPELVHGALISYPRYFSYSVSGFVTPEDALNELVLARNSAENPRKYSRDVLRTVLSTFYWLTGSRR